MNTLDKKYQDLLSEILKDGSEKKDRTGTGTISIFGKQIRHNMSEGFPLLTTKKMAIKSIMTELKWFLKGDTNIKYLVENGCHIWNGDAYKQYERVWNWDLDTPSPMIDFIERIKTDGKFAEIWGELGPIYGKQWRNWARRTTREEKIVNPGVYTEHIDQIQNLIEELKTNPDSRRLMVSAWNVGELNQMVLPPCHYGFQVYTRKLSLNERRELVTQEMFNQIYNAGDSNTLSHSEIDQWDIPKRAISLSWNQRSVDTFLGLPFNIASYGMLLCLLAEEVNMFPEELIVNLGDTHLYSNHIDQAREQVSREPMPHLPKLKLSNVDILNGEFDYEILHYHSHPAIKAPLSN